MNKDFIKDELKQLFYLFKDKDYYIYELQEVEPKYKTYFISDGNWKGVAIPIGEEFKKEEFLANFENIKICIQNKNIFEDKQICLLSLLTKDLESIDKFILLCMDFILPGNNGENRKALSNNPQEWVNKWKSLLGNKSENDMDYSFLGELIILYYLLSNNEKIELTNYGSYDIESTEKNYEVKTTIMKYMSVIEVHSQYQLKKLNNNPLELYFVRLEEANVGISINRIIELLNEKSYDINKINKKIKDISTESREKIYRILEIRKYNIDERFPKITSESFKNDVIPKNIIGIKYTIDLDGINYEKINFEEGK